MTLYKDKKVARILIGLCTCLLLTGNISAQLHAPNRADVQQLTLAEELFAQKQYKNAEAAAKRFLQQQDASINIPPHAVTDKAKYLLAECMLQLDEQGAELVATNFINTTANPAYKQRTAYALAQNYFRKNLFADAIRYYELADIYNLNNEEIILAKFELAYCYFNNSQFNEAEPLLASVRELDGKYYDAGNYYYGLLAYNRNNYADALTSFNRIENNPEYRNIVPYYIAEIHYYTGDRQKALQDAVRLIKREEKSYYHNELHLLAAQVHFEEEAYAEALPYFEYYYDHTERIRKEDLYEMAYCYYKTGDWQSAIDNFQQLSETRDSLAQSSMYLLGDCYLKTNDKKSARNAFSICSDMPFNAGQKEASLLLAGKLSYELGHNNDAIYFVNLLLADFPTSQYGDEAKTILSDLLIRTSNYAEAYETLLDVSNRDEQYNKIFQKVTYGYAMQQMQAGNNSFADSLLTAAVSSGSNTTYEAAANFWKADLAYKAARYDDVLSHGNRFVAGSNKSWVAELSPAATDRNMYITLGYAAMDLSKYAEAQGYFGKAKYYSDARDSSFIIAATLREADAVFMQKGYKNAIVLYDKVIAGNGADADYARYQKAIILGLTGNNKGKTEILTGLINTTPASAILP